MKIKSNRKRRNVKKYKYSKTLKASKKRNTIRGGEIPPPSRRMSTGSLEQTSIYSKSARVSNLLNDKYKLCKEILGTKQAIYGEGKVRRAIVNNINVLQSGNDISLGNIEGNNYHVTLNPNDRDDIKEITTSNPFNSTQYPVILVDKNVSCQPGQQFGGVDDDDESPPPFPSQMPQIQPNPKQPDVMLVDDNEPPPLPSSLIKKVELPSPSSSMVSDYGSDDDVLVPLPQNLQVASADTSAEPRPPVPLTIEEQLKGCHQNLEYYFGPLPSGERLRLLDNIENLQAENFRLTYPGYVPPEYQVRSSGFIPYIRPQDLFEQIRNLKLDINLLNTNTNLELIAELTRKEPNLFKGPTKNYFYRLNVSPPPNEKLFDAVGPRGQQVQIPYPAVVFLRCQLSGDGKKMIIHGVYLVKSDTFFELEYIRPYEETLSGIVKLETEASYNKREKEYKSTNKINGADLKYDLKINARETEMTFTGGPESEVLKLKEAIKIERVKIPLDRIVLIDKVKAQEKAKGNMGYKTLDDKIMEDKIIEERENDKEIGTEYALTRFHVNDVNKQKVHNLMKNISHSIKDNTIPVASGVVAKPVGLAIGKSIASSIGSALTSLVSGGKRKNMKYTINKIKNRKKRNTKKNKK